MSAMPGVRALQWLAALTAGAGALALAAVLGFAALDRAFPPDLSRLDSTSRQVVDRDGRALRTYLAADGSFRLATRVEDVDPRYLDLLIAFEDKRFQSHAGVDPLALVRALAQAIARGRIVSGASTLTMQTARLLEPRPRTLTAKLIEMFRALQLERRYSKREILGIYLTLAPFGGNLEGVEAAAEAYFGRPPTRLTAGEAALLVALPRAPSRFRPDRHPAGARAARNEVLERAGLRAGFRPDALALAGREPVPTRLRAQTFLAPHLADRLIRAAPGAGELATPIDGALQAKLEARAPGWVAGLGPEVGLAVLVVENAGRRVRAYLGSADFRDDARDGQVDAVAALRSPGSALKPIIYGLAFDRGLAHPATLVEDAPRQFGDYAPANFMQDYYGEVTLADALRLSLNVPAVAVLEKLGPVAFAERLRRDGIQLALADPGQVPGLALALGGVGITLEDLVRLYAALADDGRLRPLSFRVGTPEAGLPNVLLRTEARWQIGEILRRMPPPARQIADAERRSARGIAFKTGTSYGFRDAWAVGYSATHTVGVWVGRPDGAPNPGHYGANTAAPLLFQVFELLPESGPPAPPPARGLLLEAEALPPGLQRLDGSLAAAPALGGAAPRIVFPLDNSVLQWRPGDGALALEAEGGRRPLTWLVDGRPLGAAGWSRRAAWRPDGPGFASIVLVDAAGQRAAARVRLVAEATRGLALLGGQ